MKVKTGTNRNHTEIQRGRWERWQDGNWSADSARGREGGPTKRQFGGNLQYRFMSLVACEQRFQGQEHKIMSTHPPSKTEKCV